jgi:hypothetical protein
VSRSGNEIDSIAHRCADAATAGTSSLVRRSGRTGPATTCHEEIVMTAIIAAVLFAIGLLLHLTGLSLGPLDVTFFQLAGLIAAALHLAGIGSAVRTRARR